MGIELYSCVKKCRLTRKSPCQFTAIQTLCRELRLAVVDEAGIVIGLAFRYLDILQESRVARTLVGALEASDTEKLAGLMG